MPTETATLPVAEPLTFQPFAEIKDDAVLKEHTARSAKLKTPIRLRTTTSR